MKGTNGFLCIVERSWAQGTDDAEFWNPKMRAPHCFNAQAALAPVIQAFGDREDFLVLATTGGKAIEEIPCSIPSNTVASKFLNFSAILPVRRCAGGLCQLWHRDRGANLRRAWLLRARARISPR